MDRSGNQQIGKGNFQSMLILAAVLLLIMLAVGTTLYFLNQNNELMPDATPGGGSMESKPAGR